MTETRSCHAHPERSAVGPCLDCARWFCLDCAAVVGDGLLCDECRGRGPGPAPEVPEPPEAASDVIALPGSDAVPLPPPTGPIDVPTGVPATPSGPPKCPSCGADRKRGQHFCTSCGARLPAVRPEAWPPDEEPERPEAIETDDGRFQCPRCREVWETLYCPMCATSLLEPGTHARELEAAPPPPPPPPPPPRPPSPPPEEAGAESQRRAAIEHAARAWQQDARLPDYGRYAEGAEPAPNLGVRAAPSVPERTTLPFAAVWQRALAMCIDGFLAMTIWLVQTQNRTRALQEDLWSGRSPWDPVVPGFSGPLMSWGQLVLWGLIVVLVAWRGQSPGKMIAGIRIVDAEGRAPGVLRAIVREVIGKTASTVFLFVGYFVAVVDPRRQALHDKLAGTFVVKGHPGRATLPPARTERE